MFFEFGVNETTTAYRKYVVEADTVEEAKEKAERGETIEEETKYEEVADRLIVDGPEKLEESYGEVLKAANGFYREEDEAAETEAEDGPVGEVQEAGPEAPTPPAGT